MHRRGRKMTALALALLLVLGAGGCTPQKKGSAGILYRVTGGKSDLYLLGSIHVGSEDMYPLGQHILDAMEAADVLYGVTMQEDGVSKLLTLTLSEPSTNNLLSAE